MTRGILLEVRTDPEEAAAAAAAAGSVAESKTVVVLESCCTPSNHTAVLVAVPQGLRRNKRLALCPRGPAGSSAASRRR